MEPPPADVPLPSLAPHVVRMLPSFPSLQPDGKLSKHHPSPSRANPDRSEEPRFAQIYCLTHITTLFKCKLFTLVALSNAGMRRGCPLGTGEEGNPSQGGGFQHIAALWRISPWLLAQMTDPIRAVKR